MTVLAAKPTSTIGVEPGKAPLPQSMIERLTLILDVFDTPKTRMTLEQVSRATGLPRSTTHRILDQLVQLEWLAHSSSGYGLGGRSLRLGCGGSVNMQLRSAAAPYLHSLSVRTGMVAELAVLEGAQICFLDKLGGAFAAQVPSQVGAKVFAHRTCAGRAMLAWLPAEEVEALIGIEGSAANGDGDRVLALHHQLSRVRARHGLTFDRGELVDGLATVAVAVRDAEGPVGAVSLVGPEDVPLERVAPLVVEAARAISAELFPDLQPSQSRRGRRWTPRLAG